MAEVKSSAISSVRPKIQAKDRFAHGFFTEFSPPSYWSYRRFCPIHSPKDFRTSGFSAVTGQPSFVHSMLLMSIMLPLFSQKYSLTR